MHHSTHAASVESVAIDRIGNLFEVDFVISMDSDISDFEAIADRVDWLPLLTPMVEQSYYSNFDKSEVTMHMKTCVLWKCWYLSKVSSIEQKPDSITMRNMPGKGSFIVADENIRYGGNSNKTTIQYNARLKHKYRVPTWITNGMIAFVTKFEVLRGAKRLEQALNGHHQILSTPF